MEEQKQINEIKNVENVDYSKLNIYQKMSLATVEIQKVKKNLKVGEGTKSEYKATKEADILNAVKPIENKLGIYSYPNERKIISQDRLTFNTKYGDVENFVIRLEITYRFVNVDKPEEYIEIKSYGDGIDSQDKAPGKALTYADKYALLKAYKVETGDEENQKPQAVKRLTKEEELKKKTELIVKLDRLARETDTDKELIYQTYKVENNTKMSITQLEQAVKHLEKKPKVNLKNEGDIF